MKARFYNGFNTTIMFLRFILIALVILLYQIFHACQVLFLNKFVIMYYRENLIDSL